MNIQQFLSDYSAARKLNGTIIVAEGDKIVAEQNLGFADLKSGSECTRDTQYQIGSVTKQFTAAAVLQAFYDLALSSGTRPADNTGLISAVKKSLQQPIAYFLPENSAWWSGKMPNWAKEVTVHQLLQHSSGIQSYTSFPEYKETFFSSPPGQVELIALFKDRELEFKPGTMFSYCNSGYILLGAIVSEVAKCSFAEYLERHVFQPLNLRDTAFPENGTVKELKREARYGKLAYGYEFNVAEENPEPYEIKRYLPMQVPGPAGAMISNAPDLLAWNNALFGGKVMPSFLLDIMLSSAISLGVEGSSYAYGIEIRETAKLGKFYLHSGGIDGYKSILVHIPKLDMSIICLTNLVGGGKELLDELDKLNASLPHTLSDQEKTMQLQAALNSKFPFLEHNKDRFNATAFADELIKQLNQE